MSGAMESLRALRDLRGLRHLSLDVQEAGQLLQLRSLRRRRAELAWAQACQALEAAREAVAARHHTIAATRSQRQRLLDDLGGALAPRLPRWAAQVGAQQARLDEQLEREEYALIDDERQLERAQDTVQIRQQELARLQQREDLAQGLVQQQKRQNLARDEQRRELALEELRRP
jgi:hypothetical protein